MIRRCHTDIYEKINKSTMKAIEISKDFLLEFEKNRGKGRKKKGSRDGNPQPTNAIRSTSNVIYRK